MTDEERELIRQAKRLDQVLKPDSDGLIRPKNDEELEKLFVFITTHRSSAEIEDLAMALDAFLRTHRGAVLAPWEQQSTQYERERDDDTQ